MADIKISQLAAASALAAADTFEVVQGGTNKKATGAQVGALVPRGYIDGLKMEWVSGTSLRVTSGAAFIASRGNALELAASVTKAGLSLSASTWYHVYLFDNSGAADIEVVSTAPDSPYAGTARAKTGDPSRRYIGSLRTNGSGSIFKFVMVGARVTYLSDVTAAPFRVLSNGTSTSWTSVSFAAVVPSTSVQTYSVVQNIDAVVSFNISSGSSGADFSYVVNAKQVIPIELPLGSAQTFNYQAVGSTSTGLYADVLAYTFER